MRGLTLCLCVAACSFVRVAATGALAASKKLSQVETVAAVIRRGKKAEEEGERWRRLAGAIAKDVQATGERWAAEKAELRRNELMGLNPDGSSPKKKSNEVDEEKEALRFHEAHVKLVTFQSNAAKSTSARDAARTDLQNWEQKQHTASSIVERKTAREATATKEVGRVAAREESSKAGWAEATARVAQMAFLEKQAHAHALDEEDSETLARIANARGDPDEDGGGVEASLLEGKAVEVKMDVPAMDTPEAFVSAVQEFYKGDAAAGGAPEEEAEAEEM